MATSDKLRQMRDIAPDQSDAIANSIEQINQQIVELTEEANAIQAEVTSPTEVSAIDLIENTIISDQGGDYATYGSAFGAIQWLPTKGNLTDFEIWDILPLPIQPPLPAPPIPPLPDVLVYVYNRGDYPDLDQWVDDYAFGNDYLTRPLYASGEGSEASYGIYPSISSLGIGKGYQQQNKNKVDGSIDVFTRYID